jgi:hypothetical protein
VLIYLNVPSKLNLFGKSHAKLDQGVENFAAAINTLNDELPFVVITAFLLMLSR